MKQGGELDAREKCFSTMRARSRSLIVVFFTVCTHGQLAHVYTPPSVEVSPGNSQIAAHHCEYQQIFDAFLSSSIPVGGGANGEISFHSSRNSRNNIEILSDVVIELSTISKAPNSLSQAFSENQGVDKFVYWRGQTVQPFHPPDPGRKSCGVIAEWTRTSFPDEDSL